MLTDSVSKDYTDEDIAIIESVIDGDIDTIEESRKSRLMGMLIAKGYYKKGKDGKLVKVKEVPKDFVSTLKKGKKKKK